MGVRERKSEIRILRISRLLFKAQKHKTYVNREEGFVGTPLKRDEYVTGL
jgi:hypothetical protein